MFGVSSYDRFEQRDIEEDRLESQPRRIPREVPGAHELLWFIQVIVDAVNSSKV